MSAAALSQVMARQLIDLWRSHDLAGAASDDVYAVLHQAILSRILPPGQRLGEEHLATLFDVSRTPVREALLRLEAENFADRIPRRGLVVSRITPQEIVDVYVVREAMDGMSALLAAENGTFAQISNLEWINEQISSAAQSGDLPLLAELNLQFHEAMAQAAGNALLESIVGQIHQVVRRFHPTTFSYPGRAASAVEEHRELIRAIIERDGERARELAHQHMSTARRIRIAMLHEDAKSKSD